MCLAIRRQPAFIKYRDISQPSRLSMKQDLQL